MAAQVVEEIEVAAQWLAGKSGRSAAYKASSSALRGARVWLAAFPSATLKGKSPRALRFTLPDVNRGKFRNELEMGRHHVLGQALAPALSADAEGCGGSPLVAATKATNCSMPASGPHRHGHGGNARLGGNGPLDLPQFHAESANLHLVVGPAQVVQLACRVDPSQIAGAIHPRVVQQPLASGLATNRWAVSSGWPR